VTIKNIVRRPYLPNERKSHIAGQKFGKLTAIEQVGFAGTMAVWSFRCDCGTIVERRAGHTVYAAKNPNAKQYSRLHCGCIAKVRRWESRIEDHRTAHNRWRSRLDKGLLCEAWQNFDVFLEQCWSEKEPGKFLCRFDRTKPLGLDNFYWGDVTEKGMAELEDFVQLAQTHKQLTLEEAWEYVFSISRQRREQLRKKWTKRVQGAVATGGPEAGLGVRGPGRPRSAIRTPDVLPAGHSTDPANRLSGPVLDGLLQRVNGVRTGSGNN
jgi:hypothetical protein